MISDHVLDWGFVSRQNFLNAGKKKIDKKKSAQTDLLERCKNKKCIKCNNKQPVFNYENEKKALYCGDCRLENMIDVISKRCITPFCYKQQHIDNYCCRCFYALNPNDKRCRRIKIKENEVKLFIQNEFKDLSFIFPIKEILSIILLGFS